jgi:hypothetical protein
MYPIPLTQGRGIKSEKRGAVGAKRPRTPFFAQFSPPRIGERPGVGGITYEFDILRKQLVKTLDKVKIHAIIKSLKQVNYRWIAGCEPL